MNGVDCFFEGLSLITRPGLRRYVIIPIVINVIVLASVVAYGLSQYDALTALVTESLPDWLSFLSGVFAFIAALLLFVLVLFLFTIVANIIASPFNAILAEKVEERLTGRRPYSGSNIAVILMRSLWREVGKLLYYLPRLLGLVILTLIPGVNAVSPFLWILFGAWMMAVQYADYAADNNGVSFRDMREHLGQNRLQSVIFGVFVYGALAIPILNLVLMPAAVAGGTVLWIQTKGVGGTVF